MSEQIETREALDALPDHNVLILASGHYPIAGRGSFHECWLRPIPEHITGEGPRTWEVLTYGMSWPDNLVTTEDITLPATVLFRPDAPTPTPAGDRQAAIDAVKFRHYGDDEQDMGWCVLVGDLPAVLAASASTPAGDDQREALARVIDTVYDQTNTYVPRRFAFDAADKVLAWLATRPSEGVAK